MKTISASVRIGKKLRELRLAKKMTQQQVSDATGIPRSNISQIESGKHSISVELLTRLADVLGVSIKIE